MRSRSLTQNPNPDPIPSFTPPASSPSSSPAPTANPFAQPSQPDQSHADPDEVDISQHFYKPETTNRIPVDPNNMSENQLRQMMLGLDPSAASGPGGPNEPNFGDDPMMKMLQQMMGGAGGPNPFAAAGGAPGAGGPFGMQTPPQQQPVDTYAAVWRVLHFIVALGLGLYIALLTSFSGTKTSREREAIALSGFRGGAGSSGAGDPTTSSRDNVVAAEDDLRRYFFWAFATAETVLLTSRFFLDRSRGPPPGVLGTIMGFLPDGAWKGYLGVALRYSQIFSTVRSDMLVCVFVLGVCAWLRS